MVRVFPRSQLTWKCTTADVPADVQSRKKHQPKVVPKKPLVRIDSPSQQQNFMKFFIQNLICWGSLVSSLSCHGKCRKQRQRSRVAARPWNPHHWWKLFFMFFCEIASCEYFYSRSWRCLWSMQFANQKISGQNRCSTLPNQLRARQNPIHYFITIIFIEIYHNILWLYFKSESK